MLLINFIAGMSLVIAMATGSMNICATGLLAVVCFSGAEVISNVLTRKKEA